MVHARSAGVNAGTNACRHVPVVRLARLRVLLRTRRAPLVQPGLPLLIARRAVVDRLRLRRLRLPVAEVVPRISTVRVPLPRQLALQGLGLRAPTDHSPT